jgi:hypothetical protein
LKRELTTCQSDLSESHRSLATLQNELFDSQKNLAILQREYQESQRSLTACRIELLGSQQNLITSQQASLGHLQNLAICQRMLLETGECVRNRDSSIRNLFNLFRLPNVVPNVNLKEIAETCQNATEFLQKLSILLVHKLQDIDLLKFPHEMSVPKHVHFSPCRLQCLC